MAVSADALTLGQYAIQSNDPRVQKITYSLLKNGAFLDDLPLVTKKSLIANGVRFEANLPTPTWNKLNTEPTVTSGTPTPFQEQAYIVRNAIDVDHFLVEDENAIQDPRGVQVEAFLQALSYDMNDKWINNGHVTGDDDAFVGIRTRLDNPTVYGLNSELKIDAGALDMSLGGMTAATANTFLEYIQQLLSYLGREDGNGVVLYMNDVMKRRFATAIRKLGAGAGFTMTSDAYGRQISSFNGAKIVDIGRKADQSTRIITYTETSAGVDGASDHTSIYAAVFGEDRLMGWQFKSIQEAIEDLGKVGNAGTILRFLIDWAFGLYSQHTRCMGRIYGIKVK